jgi:hypothetical protein
VTGPHFGDNINTWGSHSVGKVVGSPEQSAMPSWEMPSASSSGLAWKVPLAFINYRNTDEPAAASIEAELIRRLGPGAAFRDRTIPAGTDFPRELLDKARRCRLMLTIIGEKWDHPDHGLRLLHAPDDWVRIEIGIALTHDVTVVPIMVGFRSRLVADDLPPDIRQLAYLQGRHLRQGYDAHDVRRLVADLL